MDTSYKSSKKPDLEDRTLKFASDIVGFIEQIPRSIPNNEIAKQVVRSAGSVGANYIEANEALGKKDFLLRLRICRKEAKETAYWLKLILVSDVLNDKRNMLLQEANELTKIFGAIVTKLQATEKFRN
jgi:four helix bundle protein